MINRTLFLSLLSLALGSGGCGTTPPKAIEIPISPSKLKFEERSIVKESTPCDEKQCAKLSLRYFEVTEGPEPVRNALNEIVSRELMKSPLTPAPPLEKRAEEFLEDFKEHRDLGIAQWEVDGIARIFAQTKNTIAIDIDEEGFTGGAHGYDRRTLLTVDRNSGKILTWRDLIRPESASQFVEIGEEEFRQMRNLDPVLSLNEQGFEFPGNRFKLPENCVFTEDGFLFRFDAYDVGSYAMGESEFAIPMDRVQEMLRTEYRPILPVVAESPKKESPPERAPAL